MRQSDETTLVFEPVLDVTHARHLYSELDGALAAAAPMALDAACVERVDAATLQLLAAFCCAARAAQLPLRWQGASTVLCRSAALLNLYDTLGLPT